MLHAKFQDHMTISSVEEDFNTFTRYGHGGHLGHVIWTIYINLFSFQMRLHMEFGFNLPSGFGDEDV